jgi:hypothetical protein
MSDIEIQLSDLRSKARPDFHIPSAVRHAPNPVRKFFLSALVRFKMLSGTTTSRCNGSEVDGAMDLL